MVERFAVINRISGPYPPDFFKKLPKRQEEYMASIKNSVRTVVLFVYLDFVSRDDYIKFEETKNLFFVQLKSILYPQNRCTKICCRN